MSEQCAQTNGEPLRLSPDSTSFYRWGTAEQYSRGGSRGVPGRARPETPGQGESLGETHHHSDAVESRLRPASDMSRLPPWLAGQATTSHL